ncbi:amino acid transporter [Rhizodiscina lignyota]|uniref:Amino acid transporter n=1 Tax=Rhizodiscina lignyota TaxID=1504668 RepID=A0A9P4I2K5_9PEZI|nr:amino acid transporter [Rhizodiscina lignyota]
MAGPKFDSKEWQRTSQRSAPEQESSDVDDNAAQPVPSAGRASDRPLERYIALKPIVAFGLTLQSSWEAIAISFQSSLLNGGPISLVYGMLIVTLGSTALAASLGEMASVDPAVGAQYRWAARYAPRSMKPQFWGFMQGWLTVLAWIASCALTPFTLGTMLQGLIEFNYPDYAPKPWHGTLLMWVFIVLPVFWNFFARRLLVALEITGGIFHFIFFLATVVTLGVLVPRNSNDFVWNTSVSGLSGWNNSGVTFCLGLLSPAFAVAGFDGVLHMSDETKDAPRRAPRGMVLTVVINGILAFCFIICLMYTMGDLDTALTSTSLPILTVFYNATGSVPATNALMSFIIIVSCIGDFSIFASVSRLTWAFARDRGLPFSDFFAYVHPTLKIPVNALGLVAVLCALLALINLGSSVAFYAVISLSTLSLFISYIPPITFLLIRKLQGQHTPSGPWNLGRFGIPINVFGLCYAIFMIVWLPFPTQLPVTGRTMNYAAPVWGGCMLLAMLDYVTTGRKRFQIEG